MKSIVTFILCLFFVLKIYSQSFIGSLNGVYRVDNKSSGYSVKLMYEFEKIGLRIGLGQTMASSLRPNAPEGYTVGIREYKQYYPYGGVSIFKWDASAFPGINLRTRDNKYFKFELFFLLTDIIRKGNFNVNTGLVLSFKDEQEIQGYIKAERMEFIFPPGAIVYNKLIPIFNYSRFIDVGAMIQMEYKLLSFNRLDLGIGSDIFYYPISNELSFQLGLIIDILVGEKE